MTEPQTVGRVDAHTSNADPLTATSRAPDTTTHRGYTITHRDTYTAIHRADGTFVMAGNLSDRVVRALIDTFADNEATA